MIIFERLRDYFQEISNALENEKQASSIFPNPVDAGTSREDILIDFLVRHLPSRCDTLKGGFIFDSLGNESKQIDLIIINDSTLQFKQFNKVGQQGKSFNTVEGCYAAISVKTTLDKNNLIDSLKNIASIPPMPDLQSNINPFLKGKESFQDLPYKVVFAFNGIAPDTLMKHIVEYYSKNAVPENRRPDLIIVNNKYMIVHLGKEGGLLRNGAQYPPYSFIQLAPPNVGSYSLVFMLTKIQIASTFGSQILLNFENYIDKIPFEN